MIFDFLKFAVYEAHRRLNINEICKNYRFKYWIILRAILKSVFLYLIENVSKITVWSSNHVNLVNDNAIKINFDDLLFEILHLSFVRKFDLININLIDFRIHSLRIKLINVYNSNKRIRFRKYINLRCVFDWYSFIWFVYENAHLQLYDNNKCQFIWCCIKKIINNTQNYVELDKINILENCFRSIRNIRFENVEHCKFFYRTNMMKKRTRLIWILNEEVIVDWTYNAFNNAFHAMF